MSIPVIKVETVFHIGSLDVKNRGQRGESMEGHLFSVSTCPTAWKKIARIGGSPLHQISKEEGALFLDVLAVAQDAKLKAMIEDWSISQGMAQRKVLWKAWNYDSESENWCYGLYLSKDEASNEVDGEEDAGPNGVGCVEPVETLIGTAALSDRVQIKDLSSQDAFDYCAMTWAHETMPKIDGVWWLETYEPEALSAPRGGIFPEKMDGFSVKPVSWGDAPNEEDGVDVNGSLTSTLMEQEESQIEATKVERDRQRD